jgi:hypothetical protein
MSKGDKDGKTTLLKMWTKAEDDQYGLLARDERLVDLAEDAIGKSIYLYSCQVPSWNEKMKSFSDLAINNENISWSCSRY